MIDARSETVEEKKTFSKDQDSEKSDQDIINSNTKVINNITFVLLFYKEFNASIVAALSICVYKVVVLVLV